MCSSSQTEFLVNNNAGFFWGVGGCCFAFQHEREEQFLVTRKIKINVVMFTKKNIVISKLPREIQHFGNATHG